MDVERHLHVEIGAAGALAAQKLENAMRVLVFDVEAQQQLCALHALQNVLLCGVEPVGVTEQQRVRRFTLRAHLGAVQQRVDLGNGGGIVEGFGVGA